MPFRVSVVGKGGHARRLIDLVRGRDGVHLDWVYYPRDVAGNDLPLTTDFDRLFDSDAVIVASPTPTHFDYLQRLEPFEGYVLVEKPAVSTLEQSRVIADWPRDRKDRTKVNYNLSHSGLAQLIKRSVLSQEIGDPIYLDVHMSHGLAYLPKYKASWRSDPTQSLGVAEVVGVHFINLCMEIFGPMAVTHSDLRWLTGRRDENPDTVRLTMSTESGPTVNLFLSYAAPLRTHVTLVGTNGIFEYDGSRARMQTPRETFDSEGSFKAPPVKWTSDLDFRADWVESLELSMGHFLETAREGGRFDSALFELALQTMEPILSLRNRTVQNCV